MLPPVTWKALDWHLPSLFFFYFHWSTVFGQGLTLETLHIKGSLNNHLEPPECFFGICDSVGHFAAITFKLEKNM